MSGALKYDDDVYEKVDYSLIPWELLVPLFRKKDLEIESYCAYIHRWLNGEVSKQDFDKILSNVLSLRDCLKHLAISRGYGTVKYERNDWENGFGDVTRLLRAGLRHGIAYLRGEEYDGQPLGPYTRGNSHLGGLVVNLMFAKYELEKHQQADTPTQPIPPCRIWGDGSTYRDLLSPPLGYTCGDEVVGD